MSRWRTVMLMGDVHCPIQDHAAVDAFIAVLKDIQPDELLILGDYLDCDAPARWSKDTVAEYADTLRVEIDEGKRVLELVRNNFQGTVSYIKGNHEERIEKYVDRYAPAIKSLVPDIPQLLDFQQFNVTYQEQPYMVAPGVAAIHGGYLSSTLNGAGQSAFKARARLGYSVVQGDSHRLGLGWDTTETRRFWLEAGCLIDVSKVDYLKRPGLANWQQGYGLLQIANDKVFPSVHEIYNGTCAHLSKPRAHV